MLKARTHALRSTLDPLEARDVCSANPVVGPLPDLLPAAHVGAMAPAATTAAATPAANPALQSLVGHSSLITIKNTTPFRIKFTLQWQGGPAKQYTLAPGATWRYWNTPVMTNGWVEQPRTAKIRFDASTAAGLQQKTYTLSSQLAADGPNGPVGSGMKYHFARSGNKIDLYRTA
jgi:hypothetical protein